MKILKHTQLLSIAFFLLLAACKKEEIGPQYVDEAGGDRVVNGEKAVYVVNEGNFQSGNASLTRILLNSGTSTQRVFEKWTGRSLGDVGQSMEDFDGNFFIVVNNSGKVEVVSSGPQRQEVGTIGGMESPRYFLGLNPRKAYVTDLYADRIHILNLSEMKLTGGIATDGWTEVIHEKDGKVFVTNMDQGRLDVIDPTKDAFVDSLKLAEQPNSMVEDADGKLWVLCDGGFEEEKAALYRVDPEQVKVEKNFRFSDIGLSPSSLDISPDRRTLYFLSEGVRRMSIDAGGLPNGKLIKEKKGQFYNLEVAGKKEMIFVTDAKDYVQKGSLYRFRSDGTALDSFETGIIPNALHFRLE